MRMNLPPDRQGHLSDLSSKTLGELKELLERQEKILARSGFIKTLPDKGQKCRLFAEYLRSLISQRCDTAVVNNKTLLPDLTHSSFSKESRIPMEVMTEVKERKEQNLDLAESLQKLSIGKQDSPETTEIIQNAYERVVKKVEAKPFKERFMPCRIPQSVSDASSSRPHIPHTLVKTSPHHQKSSIPEESNVRPPEYKFKQTQMISINESVKLIDEQRTRNEKLVAENAAQRLAGQMVHKMTTYSGGTDMRYRAPKLPEQGDSDDDDDDDEGKEIDYGDEAD